MMTPEEFIPKFIQAMTEPLDDLREYFGLPSLGQDRYDDDSQDCDNEDENVSRWESEGGP